MRFILIFVLLNFSVEVGGQAWAAAASVEQIRRFVVEDGATQIEDVVRKLPQDMRRRFTLVHSGKALLETNSAYPGVILFGDTAKTLIAYNGSPDQIGFSSLDILEFDEKTQNYRPARFLFSPTAAELAKGFELERIGQTNVYLERRPQNCAQCHGENHHPIFESSYPDWAGFYGSERDHLFGSHLQAEIEKYREFQRTGMTTARYEALIFPDAKFSAVTPFLDEQTEVKLDYQSAHDYRPNLVFGSMLVRNNARGLFVKLKRSKWYREFAPLLAYSLQRCEFSDLDQAWLQKKLSKLDTLGSTIEEFDQTVLNSSMMLNEDMRMNREVGAKIIRVLGISEDHWNLSRVGLRTNEYGYWSGYGDTMDFVHAFLVQDLLDGLWKSFYSTENSPLPLLAPLGESLKPSNQAQSCATLVRI